MVENPPLGMPALKRGARGPRLSLTAPGGARLTVTVTMMVVVVMVMMMLQKHGVDGRKEVGDAGRRVGVLNVRCGCGGNLSRVLVVEPTSDRKCLPAMLRKPHELRREREGNSGGVQHRYPLKVKVRRSPEGREILVSWSLTYMPLKKRSRLSDFHVFFLTKRYRKSRKQQSRGQCFRVTGLRKVCKKKVTCKAKYLSRSRGRDGPYLQVQYQYDPSGQQKKQQKAKNQTVTYVLKASLSRRAKRRGSLGSLSLRKKSKRARKEKRSHRRQLEKQQRQMGHELFSCEAWIPTMTLSSQADRVAVTVSPVNPFATGLQLALRYAGSGSGIKPTRVLASDKHYTFTFTNVADGTYELMVLALGPQCFQARYHISNVSVSVPGSEALQDCSKWIPKVTLSLSGRSVTMHYSPVNPLATSLDIALQRPFSTLRIFSTQIPKDVTTYTFKNVDYGEYRMSIRALGPDCRSARFFISRDKVTVKALSDTDVALSMRPSVIQPEVDRNCSHWKPTITARKTAHGGSWCLIEVNIDTPPNINADKIEVAVEKSKRDSDGDGHQNEIVKVTHINVSEKKAVLNVTLEKGKSYKALVKPYGCEDCPDFQQYGEECFLSYTKVDIISDNNHEAPASILKPDKDRGPGSTLQNTQPHHGGPNSSYNNHQHHQHHLFYLYLHSDAGDSQVNEQKWQPPSADSSSHSGGKVCRSEDGPENDEPSSSPELESLNTNDAGHMNCPLPQNPAQEPSEIHDDSSTPSHYVSIYNDMHRTTPHVLFQPHHNPYHQKRVVIIHEYRTTQRDMNLIQLFLKVLTECLPHVQVKVDFACRHEIGGDVRHWVEKVLGACSRVVVVLSDPLLAVCRSYEGPQTLQVTSPCVYADIAPLVMRSIVAAGRWNRAVFVHFGLEQAYRVYCQLRDVYLCPRNYFLTGQRSSVLEHGEAVSTPPWHQPGAGYCQEPRTRVPHVFRSLITGNTVPVARVSAHTEHSPGHTADCAAVTHYSTVRGPYSSCSSCSFSSSEVVASPPGHTAVTEDVHSHGLDASTPPQPPSYSTLDHNVCNASRASWDAGPLGVATGAVACSCQPQGFAQSRMRHQSAPVKSTAGLPPAPAYHYTCPNSPVFPLATHQAIHSDVLFTDAETRVKSPAASVAVASATQIGTTATACPARPLFADQQHNPSHTVSDNHSTAVSHPDNRIPSYCESPRTGHGDRVLVSREGPISLRTSDGFMQLVWLLSDGDDQWSRGDSMTKCPEWRERLQTFLRAVEGHGSDYN